MGVPCSRPAGRDLSRDVTLRMRSLEEFTPNHRRTVARQGLTLRGDPPPPELGRPSIPQDERHVTAGQQSREQAEEVSLSLPPVGGTAEHPQ